MDETLRKFNEVATKANEAIENLKYIMKYKGRSFSAFEQFVEEEEHFELALHELEETVKAADKKDPSKDEMERVVGEMEERHHYFEKFRKKMYLFAMPQK